MNPLQKFVVRVCNINLNDAAVRFNVEQALREQRRQGKQEGLAQGRQEKPDCLRCPLYLQEQISKTMTAEETAAPTTEGKMAVYGARQRHITRQLQERTGLLMKHTRTMQEQRQRAQQQEPETKILPPVRVTRNLSKLLGTDDEPEKKIS